MPDLLPRNQAIAAEPGSTYLKRLEAAGIVTEVTGKARNRKYLASRLLNAVHQRKPKA